MNGRPSCLPVSWIVQMFGWFNADAALASRLEATEGLRVLGYIFWQEFERDEATQVGVLGLIDDTHASPAELLGQRDSGRLSGQSFVTRRH